MTDRINFKGHFKIEAFDNNHKLLDTWEDDNMIMVDARTTMSELFANLGTSTFINKFTLGTMGHVGADYLAPKTAQDNFINTKDRLFSEPFTDITNPADVGVTLLPVVNFNDVFYFNSTIPANSGYYRYMKTNTTNLTVSDAQLTGGLDWEFLHPTEKPYTYTVNFTMPGTQFDTVIGDLSTGVTELDSTQTVDNAAGSSVRVLQDTTSVTYNIKIVAATGHLQFGSSSVFTEAALYANGRIFSMKTFKGKIKDATVSLEITWKITF